MARELAIGIGLIITMLVLAPPALGQTGGATATVTPTASQPGDDLTMVFEIPPSDTAEIVVQERVNCTLTFPDGTTREICGQQGDVIEVRTNGSGGATYTVPYQAPSLTGTYEIVFDAEDTARVPAQTYRANATFQVTDDAPTPTNQTPGTGTPGAPGQPGAPGTGGDGGPGQAGDDGLAALGPRTDESRMMVSTGLSAAVLAAALVAGRAPLGGG